MAYELACDTIKWLTLKSSESRCKGVSLYESEHAMQWLVKIGPHVNPGYLSDENPFAHGFHLISVVKLAPNHTVIAIFSLLPEGFHLTMLPSLSLANKSDVENRPEDAVEQQLALQISYSIHDSFSTLTILRSDTRYLPRLGRSCS